MNKSITLIRDYKPEATPGVLRDSHGVEISKTLERPNLENNRDNPKTKENESSCIPEGVYLCKRYSSPKYPSTWEVIGVSGRSKILFHPANTVDELLGCIAPVSKIVDAWELHPKNKNKIKADKRWFGESSKTAFEKLKKFIGDEDFMLSITSTKTHCTHD